MAIEPTYQDIRSLLEDLEERFPPEEFVGEAIDVARTMTKGAEGRAELLTVAGERLARTDAASAIELHQDAIEDGGPTTIDPRVNLLKALIALGREDEVAQLLRTLRSSPTTAQGLAGLPCTVGEALEMDGRFKEAQRWYSIGLRDFNPDYDEPTVDEDLCLTGRYRVRRALGAGLDGFDRWLEADAPEAAESIRGRILTD